MKSRILIFFFYSIYLMLFFAVARLIFIAYNFVPASSMSFAEFILSFIHGARHDASITGYILLLPALSILFSAFFDGKFLKYFLTGYTFIILLTASVLIVIDIELYKNWGFRTDATPLLYLMQPKEAAASTSHLTIVILILIWIVFFSTFIFLFINNFKSLFKNIKKSNISVSAVFLLITASLFLPIRGTIGIAPINVGMVYFSDKNVFANHAAVNVIWNIGFSLSETDDVQPIKFFESEKAKEIFSELYPKTTNQTNVLKSDKPNIIIVILESFTAKVCEAVGGLPNITPNLNKYAKEGILFKNVYASGDRTDKGIVAILSGFPAQPTSSIIKFTNKTEKLPTLIENLEQNGYNSQWVCGFNIDFANLKSYLFHCKFDNIIKIEDFPNNEENAKWGVHDHIVFNKLLEECKLSKQPFVKIFMTLSSHEPFDVPMKTVFNGNEEEEKFKNSIFYTDKSIGEFIENLKKTDVWKNTLVVFVSDHGSRHPGNSQAYVPEKFHIPMIWLGGALNVKDTTINSFSSQTDISYTILSQLNIKTDKFIYSKNLFSKSSKSFAFYDFNNGFGFINDTIIESYDNNSKNYTSDKSKSQNKKEFGKAYEQVLMDDFIKK